MRNVFCLFTLLAALPGAAFSATPSIILRPGTATLDPNNTLQFTTDLSNAPASRELRWFVNGVRGGDTTIGAISTNGLYKAPAVQPTADGKVTVAVELWSTATSGAAAKKLAADTTVVIIRNTAKIALTPTRQDVGLGTRFVFQYTITGAPTTLKVRWLVNGAIGGSATVGSFDSAGVFTAPNAPPSAGTNLPIKVELLAPTAAVRVLASATGAVQLKNLTKVTLDPPAPSVPPGAKQQFTAMVTDAPTGYRLRWSVNGAAGGNATYGTITTTGLYTAPATVPATKPVVNVDVLPPGANNTVLAAKTALVTLKNAAIQITSVTPDTVVKGTSVLTVYGSGFRNTTMAWIRGTYAAVQYVSPTEVRLMVNIKDEDLGTLVSIKLSNPSPDPATAFGVIRARSTTNPLLSAAEAHRLLRQATWGPRPQDLDKLQRIGKTAWLDEQLGLPASTIPAEYSYLPLEYAQEHFLKLALNADDQLRLRIAWALHKIWVVSGVEVPSSSQYIPYLNILLNRAFGNYYDLMRDVTLSAAMGEYLNMANNVKADPASGSMPNENYAREVQQLFTIGLHRLNANGTPQLDIFGNPVPAYTEADVLSFARVFTGWTYGGGSLAAPTELGFTDKTGPLVAIQKYHDTDLKTLLNGAVLPAGQSAETDLEGALRNLFNHPNVGPFVAQQLIQQLVTSNPSGNYIQRIATVFNNNGKGVRGDLRAVVRAILLDPEANLSGPTTGKLLEPVLYVTNIVRGVQATVSGAPFLADNTTIMGQKIFFPPSVFSYFAPSYRIANGALAAPEFQIYTTATATARVNFVASLVGGSFGNNAQIPWTNLQALAGDPALLLGFLDESLLGGAMSAEMRTLILQAMLATSNEKEKVQTALYLILVSSQFQVQR